MEIAFGILLVLGLGWGMLLGRKTRAVPAEDRKGIAGSAFFLTALLGAGYGLGIGWFIGPSLLIGVATGLGIALVATILSYLVGYFV